MNSFLPTPDWIFREFSKQMRPRMSEEVFWTLAHPITGADTGRTAVPGPEWAPIESGQYRNAYRHVIYPSSEVAVDMAADHQRLRLRLADAFDEVAARQMS